MSEVGMSGYRWTDEEILAWVRALCPVNEGEQLQYNLKGPDKWRIVTITGLVRNAAADGMSREDRVVCGRALRLLGQ